MHVNFNNNNSFCVWSNDNNIIPYTTILNRQKPFKLKIPHVHSVNCYFI